MIPLSRPAERQFDDLIEHYERLDRPEAIRNLADAVQAASRQIAAGAAGLPAPTPYPGIADLAPGIRWLRQGSYWIAFARMSGHLTITGIFYKRADIPNRL